jgi:hypothetical protein
MDNYFLADATEQGTNSIWHLGWKTAGHLGLQGGLVEEWKEYIASLKHFAVRLKDEEDEIMW